MVICPIALAVGCRKCPVFSVCPVKGVIGDYKPDEPAAPPPAKEKAEKTSASAKSKTSNNRKRARSRRPRK
jgi:hypothetical protein